MPAGNISSQRASRYQFPHQPPRVEHNNPLIHTIIRHPVKLFSGGRLATQKTESQMMGRDDVRKQSLSTDLMVDLREGSKASGIEEEG